MYAVISTGGKQYRVTAGQILEVEKLEGSVGDSISLDDVLLVADGDAVTIGQPSVDGASVLAKITGQYKGKKTLSFRYRAKKRIRVRRGHRQHLTRLEIQAVSFGDKMYDLTAAKADAAPALAEPIVAQAPLVDVEEDVAAETAPEAAPEAVLDSSDLGAEAAEPTSEAAVDVEDAGSDVEDGGVEDGHVDAGAEETKNV